MPVPYAFGAATTAIPLSQLDSNFDTPITLGNTAIQLGNTVTTLNNMTLANVTISSGNVTITNVTVTTANATTVNTTTLIATTANVTTGNVTNLISGNVSLTGGNITSTAISGSTGSFTTLTTSNTVTINGGTANGVAYLDASKVLTTGSALTFDGTNFGVGLSTIPTVGSTTVLAVGAASGGTQAITQSGSIVYRTSASTSGVDFFCPNNVPLIWYQSSSEQMRLTSTGLGIGTSSPGYKLDVAGSARLQTSSGYNFFFQTSGTTARINYLNDAFSANISAAYRATDFTWQKSDGSDVLKLDSSGNLGLGVTPSAWWSGSKAMQLGQAATIEGRTGTNIATFGSNVYVNSSGSATYINNAAAARYVLNDGSHTWQIASAGTGSINFTQAMTLDASGNLLVGATSLAFAEKFRMYGNYAVFDNASYTGFIGQGSSLGTATASDFAIRSSNALAFLAGGATERARITSGGDFVVARGTGGDTTVGATLYANGTITCARSSSSNGDLNLYVYSTGAAAARFYVGMAGTVYATSTTITAISDQRLKENIQDIDVGLDAIMALKPRKFDWKTGKGKDKKGDRGWIAQEFEQVFPDMVDTWADPAPEGEEPYKAVNADLIPVLVKAIQELKAEFDAYKATHP